jgi:hypothetical protein
VLVVGARCRAGTLLGFALAQVVGSLSTRSAHDPGVFIITPLVLIAVTLLAATMRRGAQPRQSLTALRYE